MIGRRAAGCMSYKLEAAQLSYHDASGISFAGMVTPVEMLVEPICRTKADVSTHHASSPLVETSVLLMLRDVPADRNSAVPVTRTGKTCSGVNRTSTPSPQPVVLEAQWPMVPIGVCHVG
jgi:hypothetical protein